MKTSEEALVAKINADREYKLISELEDIINQHSKYYSNEIIKDLKVLKSVVSFRLPSANNDWSLDILTIILFLCTQRNGYVTAEHYEGHGVSIYIDVFFADIY